MAFLFGLYFLLLFRLGLDTLRLMSESKHNTEGFAMIAILGEALFDMIGGVGNNGQPCFYHYIGGSALNTATAAARLDADVLFIGKISADMFGKQMQAHFAENNVQIIPKLCDVPENSMLGFLKLDARGSASYVFYTEGTAVTGLRAEEILSALQSYNQIQYLHVGSVAVALETSGKEILKALKKIPSHGPSLFFDPNVRPSVIDDFDLYQKRVLEIVKLSFIVKLSDEDLTSLYPQSSIAEALEALLELGAEHVVLTKGKDGLNWRSKTGLDVHVPAVDNPIVDTVGAGDTVSGALLTYLAEHAIKRGDPISKEQVEEALVFAAAAAAITTSRKGANPPKRAEVVLHN